MAAYTTDVVRVHDVSLKDEEDSVTVRLRDNRALEVFGDGSVELWTEDGVKVRRVNF